MEGTNNYFDLSPDVSNLINSFKNSGYNFYSAACDIIDNSIDAGGKKIWVYLTKNELSVSDDGCGMCLDEIKKSLILAKSSNKNDDSLGKFGLGLKTASFSQANILYVSSKKNGKINTVKYDIEESINKNTYVAYNENGFSSKLRENSSSGTCITWKGLYRLNNDKEDTSEKFNETILELKRYIEKVYSEFIKSKKINIYYNDIKLAPFDPFYSSDKKTKLLLEEVSIVHEDKITLKAFDISRSINLAKEKNLLDEQGIYIYRNGRYIKNIGWIEKSSHQNYNMLRIKMDIGGLQDDYFELNFKKDNIVVPKYLKNRVKNFQRVALNILTKEQKKSTSKLDKINDYVFMKYNNYNIPKNNNIYVMQFLDTYNIKKKDYDIFLKNCDFLVEMSKASNATRDDEERLYDIISQIVLESDNKVEKLEVLKKHEPFINHMHLFNDFEKER